MSVTAALVKELREKSGAGMMDCKTALGETNGNMDAAIDWLRTKGLATAAKKSSRVASEGLVAISVEGTKGAVIELNAETDFVARNTEFQDFARQFAHEREQLAREQDHLVREQAERKMRAQAQHERELLARARRERIFSIMSSATIGGLANHLATAVSIISTHRQQLTA